MKNEKQEIKLNCLRCGDDMDFMGSKAFAEGTDWSTWLGEWGTLLNRKEKFDIMGCKTCGKIEFFFKGVHAEYQKMKNESDK